MRVLCAGDEFIGPDLLVAALRPLLPEGTEYVTDTSGWPGEPWSGNEEVQETSGEEHRIAELAADADAVVTHLAPITAAVLAGAHRLRVVATPRGGPTNVNLAAATDRGVAVLNLPGRNARAVAEFTVGILIAGQRHIATSAAAMRRGEWTGELYRYTETGTELASRTVGLIGLGQVGSRVAELLRAFGMRVLAHDPYVDPDVAAERGVQPSTLEELLSTSDIVSLHARLTGETREMIDATALARMKPGAYLVNTARGQLVDEPALLAALESGHLGGAALDTYAAEPAAANPLVALPTVLAVSHLAGASRDVAERGARRIAADTARFLTGGQPWHCLNPEVLRG